MLAIPFLSNFLCLVITAGVGVLKIGSSGRAHEACWLRDGLGWKGLSGRLGLVAQPGEVPSCVRTGGKSGMGRFCFCYLKQSRHDLPARICRHWRRIDKSLLCISARKRHGHIKQAMGEWNGISAWRRVSGRLGRSSSGWKECVLGYGRHLEMMDDGDVETLPVYIT